MSLQLLNKGEEEGSPHDADGDEYHSKHHEAIGYLQTTKRNSESDVRTLSLYYWNVHDCIK
jgi:hypothetical protein